MTDTAVDPEKADKNHILRQLRLPGGIPEQEPLGEPSCSLIRCPKSGPDKDFHARVRARRLAARKAFEGTLAVWSGGNFAIVPEIANKWWPGT